MLPVLLILEISDIIDQYYNSYAKFNEFQDGLFFAIYGITILYVFCYLASRGHTENPHADAFEIMVPVSIVALFASLLGFTKPITGVFVLVTYYFATRANVKMRFLRFTRFVIYVSLALGIGAYLSAEVGFFYLLILFGAMYIQGNMRLEEKKKVKKSEEKKK